ncbi:putative WRKY transcription factor 20 [Dorcoceras hygrometricum]|uniref:Putative WRKY transcription factor 20 n=1 Tax=Dorcoceras hygrometricum TaxID=472368 RepID=A0A2Z7CL44_9LAMI|nr:putative WRKY transcription factor 20 [Dorcoceras hygrometricum]
MESNHIGDISRSPSSAPMNNRNQEIYHRPPPPHVDQHENIVTDRGGGGSIAERRAAKCGFNVRNMNVQPRFLIRTTHTPPHLTSPTLLRSPYFTVPPGISPSALLDSPVMLPNAQGSQLSPTTGTFQFPSPNHDKLKIQWKLAADGNMEPCSVANNYTRPQNKAVEKYFGYPVDLQESEKKELVEKQQKGAYFPKEVTRSSEDGYYWRKYGQKHVKGSEYPRSYYKCTHSSCLVKKKVERSHDGHITEIVYKGSHNHPKPQPLKRFGADVQDINNETAGSTLTRNIGLDSSSCLNGACASNPSVHSTFQSDPMNRDFEAQELNVVEDQEVESTESMSFHDEDDDQNDESDSKKRKRESLSIDQTSISRSTREPRVVVQIESEIDILDDGYRWRKYGQKVVKGNPNPRSYYKCTSPSCPVRKHVERAANDLKSVITTYEGKHNHEVPAAASKNMGAGLVMQTDHQPPQAAPTSLTEFSSAATSNNAPKQGAGKQLLQHLPPPMYNLNKTKSFIFNYNDHHLIMRSNSNMAPTTGNNLLNFGSSSANYPVSFPPFHYGSLLMNGNFIKNYPTANYPINSTGHFPEFMSSMNPVQAAGPAVNGGNFHIGNYGVACNQAQEMRECHGKAMKPKEEKRDEGDHIYDSCLSVPNHGNGIM